MGERSSGAKRNMSDHDDFARAQVQSSLREGESVLSVGLAFVAAPIWSRVLLKPQLFYNNLGHHFAVVTNQRILLVPQVQKLMGKMDLTPRGVLAIEFSDVASVETFNPMVMSMQGVRLLRADGRKWELCYPGSYKHLDGHHEFATRMLPWIEDQLAAGFPPPPPPQAGSAPVASLEVQRELGKWVGAVAAVFFGLGATASALHGAVYPQAFGYAIGSVIAILCWSSLIIVIRTHLKRKRGQDTSTPAAYRATTRGGVIAVFALIAFVAGAGHTVAGFMTPTDPQAEMRERVEAMNIDPEAMRRLPRAERRRMEREMMRRLSGVNGGRLAQRHAMEQMEHDANRAKARRVAGPMMMCISFVYGPIALLLLVFGLRKGFRERVASGGLGAVVGKLSR